MLKQNVAELFFLLLDLMPAFFVKTDSYIKFRRRLSATPQRFDTPVPNSHTYIPDTWQGRNLVRHNTHLAIEGFPGSGNSFVSNTLRDALPETFYIESHFHYTAQLKRIIAFQVPNVVVVRDPAGACQSFKSMFPQLFDWLIILRWLHYHAFVLRHAPSLNIFIFQDFIEDIDIVYRRHPFIKQFSTFPLAPQPVYLRKSPNRTPINTTSWLNRWLLSRAKSIYEDILRAKA